jgi:formylglycine-generating enzyme
MRMVGVVSRLWIPLLAGLALATACEKLGGLDDVSFSGSAPAGSGGEASFPDTGLASGSAGAGGIAPDAFSEASSGSSGDMDAAGELGASGGSAGGGGDGGNGGSGGASVCQAPCSALEQCWNGVLCVAKSVSLPTGFAIDATEVTQAQYHAWLATTPSASGQTPLCSWNTSYSPEASCLTSGGVCEADCSNHPQVCVDWCDAYAYCRGVGKRLCGRLGGGPNEYDDWRTASLSQWHNACSSNGTNGYPYGDTYDAQRCNGFDKKVWTTMPVDAGPACQSAENGYRGVFGLSGNVWEWEDSCDSSQGRKDSCRLRGGSFENSPGSLQCDTDWNYVRDTSNRAVGFRCCAP